MARLKRGEIWTAAGGPDYARKPRPVVIVQDEQFDATDSITVALCTSDPSELPLFRVLVTPSSANGLIEETRIMGDKITTVPRSKIGQQVGVLTVEDMARLDRAITIFLGLATTN